MSRHSKEYIYLSIYLSIYIYIYIYIYASARSVEYFCDSIHTNANLGKLFAQKRHECEHELMRPAKTDGYSQRSNYLLTDQVIDHLTGDGTAITTQTRSFVLLKITFHYSCAFLTFSSLHLPGHRTDFQTFPPPNFPALFYRHSAQIRAHLSPLFIFNGCIKLPNFSPVLVFFNMAFLRSAPIDNFHHFPAMSA